MFVTREQQHIRAPAPSPRPRGAGLADLLAAPNLNRKASVRGIISHSVVATQPPRTALKGGTQCVYEPATSALWCPDCTIVHLQEVEASKRSYAEELAAQIASKQARKVSVRVAVSEQIVFCCAMQPSSANCVQQGLDSPTRTSPQAQEKERERLLELADEARILRDLAEADVKEKLGPAALGPMQRGKGSYGAPPPPFRHRFAPPTQRTARQLLNSVRCASSRVPLPHQPGSSPPKRRDPNLPYRPPGAPKEHRGGCAEPPSTLSSRSPRPKPPTTPCSIPAFPTTRSIVPGLPPPPGPGAPPHIPPWLANMRPAPGALPFEQVPPARLPHPPFSPLITQACEVPKRPPPPPDERPPPRPTPRPPPRRQGALPAPQVWAARPMTPLSALGALRKELETEQRSLRSQILAPVRRRFISPIDLCV